MESATPTSWSSTSAHGKIKVHQHYISTEAVLTKRQAQRTTGNVRLQSKYLVWSTCMLKHSSGVVQPDHRKLKCCTKSMGLSWVCAYTVFKGLSIRNPCHPHCTGKFR